MQIGDLIKEVEYPEVGLIVKIDDRRKRMPYHVLCPNGKIQAFSKHYVEEMCEVIGEKK